MTKLDDLLTMTADVVFLIKKFSAQNKDLFERLEQGQYTENDLKLLDKLHKSLEQASNGQLEKFSHDELMDL